jgi:hypothetical protein
MRFVESRRWTSVIAAMLVGAIGGSLVGFTTAPRPRADAQPGSTTTTVAARHRSSHATVTLAPTSSRFRPVATPRTTFPHSTTTDAPATTTARTKRTTTTAPPTTTTSTTVPPSSSSSSTSTSESTTSSTETSTSSTETTSTGTGSTGTGSTGTGSTDTDG